MSEDRDRLSLVILMVVFVVAFIVLGARFVENGRYTQYDNMRNNAVTESGKSYFPPGAFDTRTGKKK